MDDIVYREMTADDIEQVYGIEIICFTQPWSRASLLAEVKTNGVARYFVADDNGKIAGYAGMWILFDEAHMTNIAVLPEYRRHGIATGLILKLMGKAASEDALRMTLEVREHNYKAQRIYYSLGFAYAGTRKHYYNDTGENALILWNDSILDTLKNHNINPKSTDAPIAECP